MENNVAIIAKRSWHLLPVILFMLRKGISKGKKMMDINLILKRCAKLAGNLMFHHHNHGGCSTSSRHDSNLQFSTQREYEFSCSNNTPNPIGGKRHRNHDHFYKYARSPPTVGDDTVTVNTVKAVLEIMNSSKSSEVMVVSSYSTPALPVRVVESPLVVGDGDSMVDKKAEEFIKRFYKELRKQD